MARESIVVLSVDAIIKNLMALLGDSKYFSRKCTESKGRLSENMKIEGVAEIWQNEFQEQLSWRSTKGPNILIVIIVIAIWVNIKRRGSN